MTDAAPSTPLASRLRRILAEILGMALILATFAGLTLWHARLGGFHTALGTTVGLAVLILWFTPLIDQILRIAYKASHTSLFQKVKDWVNIGALLFALVATVGILFGFALDPSQQGFLRLIRSLFEVFAT